MSLKFNVWIELVDFAGSRCEETVTLDELGFTEDEWNGLSDLGRDDALREMIMGRTDWGYEQID